jgi:type II secretory pathway pseudopilin PulG
MERVGQFVRFDVDLTIVVLSRWHFHGGQFRHLARLSAPCAGMSYLFFLFAVAVLSAGLAATGVVWHAQVQREKEKELLFVGDQFRRAIAAYYSARTDVPGRLPTRLEDLLGDDKDITLRRFLRKIYLDPMTGKAEWGLIKNSGDKIVGVYSLSQEIPIKRVNFPAEYDAFNSAGSYRDWKFVFAAPDPTVVQAAGPPPVLVSPTPVQAAPVTNSVPAPASPQTDAPPRPIPGRKLDCGAIAQRDTTVCEAEGARWGPNTQSDCMRSAEKRQIACLRQDGQPPLPELAIHYQ